MSREPGPGAIKVPRAPSSRGPFHSISEPAIFCPEQPTLRFPGLFISRHVQQISSPSKLSLERKLRDSDSRGKKQASLLTAGLPKAGTQRHIVKNKSPVSASAHNVSHRKISIVPPQLQVQAVPDPLPRSANAPP